MPRLMIVTNSLPGFLAHRRAFLLGAVAEGYEVHVASPPSLEPHAIPAVVFHEIAFSRQSLNPFTEFQVLRRFVKLYKNVRPDIVHHISIKPIFYGALAAWICGTSTSVATFPGLGFVFRAKRPLAWILRAVLVPASWLLLRRKKCWAIFENPDDLHLGGRLGLYWPGHGILIKSVGVPIQEFPVLPKPSGTFTVVLASRLLRDKGVEVFVEAAAILRRKGRKFVFALAGKSGGDERGAISDSDIQAWVSAGLVEWWGFLPSPLDVFAKAHIVCLPSTYGEGVPRVLLEAASCGRPVITTDWPGCREALLDGQTGLLIAPNDAQGLANAINKLAADPSLCRSMGKKGRLRIQEEFDQSDVVEKTLALYRRIQF